MNHAFKDFKELVRFNVRLQHYAHNLKNLKSKPVPTPGIMKLGTFSFSESSTEIIKEQSRNSMAFKER